jgi:hypothetical protein
VTAPADPPDDLWVVVFRPRPDAVPGAVRMRRLIKAADRYYRVEVLRTRAATPEERERHAKKRKKPPEEKQ